MNHRYLVTLEIISLEAGKTYGELPAHLTLMSRFFSNLEPVELVNALRPLFEKSKPLHLTFGEITELGPKKITAHTIDHSTEISHLHHQLLTLLDSIHVNYEYPQFIAQGYKPHVTHREVQTYRPGDSLLSKHCYLIEIVEGKRLVITKFRLSA